MELFTDIDLINGKILEKIQNDPERRREWMLERFKKATEIHTRNKNCQF